MNVIDKAVELVAPGWALKRHASRQMLELARNYDAAKQSNRDNWNPVNGTAEQTDATSRPVLMAKARGLERNNDIVGSAIEATLRNVIGTGIRPQARVKLANGKYDEKTNKAIESEWQTFVETCDITGHQNFYEIEEMVLRRRIVDGEIMVKPVVSSSENPLKLQVIEADSLDNNQFKAQKSDGYILSGVEVDDTYKPIAYWITEQSPDGFTTYNSRRIRADDMIHLFKKTRPTQVRGVSELARIITRAKEANDYLDASLIAEKIRASFAVLITKNGSAGIGRNAIDGVTNQPLENIYPGMIKYLNPGEAVNQVAPGGDAGIVKDFMQIEDRRIASATGQSYEVVTRDMSQTNYSSARQNHLEDRKTWVPMQRYMINHFCTPIYRKFIQLLALKGIISAAEFNRNPKKFYDVEWIAPGWTWIDPLKDVKATTEELNGNMTTLSEVCAEQGKDWQEIVNQRLYERKYEQETAKKLGIELNPIEGNEANGTKQKPTAAQGNSS